MVRSSLVVIFSLIILNWFYNAKFNVKEEEPQAKTNEYSILFKFLVYLGPSCSAVFTGQLVYKSLCNDLMLITVSSLNYQKALSFVIKV